MINIIFMQRLMGLLIIISFMASAMEPEGPTLVMPATPSPDTASPHPQKPSAIPLMSYSDAALRVYLAYREHLALLNVNYLQHMEKAKTLHRRSIITHSFHTLKINCEANIKAHEEFLSREYGAKEIISIITKNPDAIPVDPLAIVNEYVPTILSNEEGFFADTNFSSALACYQKTREGIIALYNAMHSQQS